MLSISLQSRAELFSTSASLIPEKWMFSNYIEAFKSANWGRYFLNSFVITAVVTVVSLVINSMAGYVFARIRFRFSKILFLVILAGMMIPPQVTMIPVFSMLRGFPLVNGNDILGNGGSGLINTYAGMILPFIAGSFGVFLCRQYYVGFPRELDDAATVDGCGRVRAFFRIYLPLSKPVLASLGVLKFTGTWNEYTWPLIMARSDSMKTVQVALSERIGDPLEPDDGRNDHDQSGGLYRLWLCAEAFCQRYSRRQYQRITRKEHCGALFLLLFWSGCATIEKKSHPREADLWSDIR